MSTTKKANDSVEEAEFEEVNDYNVDSQPDFSPFDEPVKERDYTKPKIDTSNLESELEEPTFEAPSFADFEDEVEEKPFNPSYNELGNKEKQMGAEMIADVVVDGYARLKKGMGSLSSISENKLEREFAEGNINPNIQLPIDEYGNTASIREFVKEFNDTSKEAFDTPEDFKEKVKPPLIRVFKKRGVGMTDEQLLLYYFGTDFATAGITAFGLKKSADGILKQLREQTDMMRSPNTPPPPTPTTTSEASTDVSENETEFEEPEEVFEVQPDIVAPNKKSNSNFSSDSNVPSNMPEFGDPEILKEIDKLASKEVEVGSKTKRKRGRPKKK